MDALNVSLSLTNLHCYDEGDGIGSAEPYLWNVFFKIDGETTSVTPGLSLQGTATVVPTPGNHGDLPNHDVDAGEDVPIPAELGSFSTQLTPIPLQVPVNGVTEVGGFVGLISILMEEDNTRGSAIAKGHEALNAAVQETLDGLIPKLNMRHPEPSEAEIKEMSDAIGNTVDQAISDNVDIWDWLAGAGNMDDKLGSQVFRFSHTQLEAQGISGLAMEARFTDGGILGFGGDWELQGRATGVPVHITTGAMAVTVTGIPSTVALSPVTVSGPGFHERLNHSTTFNGLPVGVYSVTADDFTTGAGKPTCRVHTPHPDQQQQTVTAGALASATVRYTSQACDL
jgi:hypothetical protein